MKVGIKNNNNKIKENVLWGEQLPFKISKSNPNIMAKIYTIIKERNIS